MHALGRHAGTRCDNARFTRRIATGLGFLVMAVGVMNGAGAAPTFAVGAVAPAARVHALNSRQRLAVLTRGWEPLGAAAQPAHAVRPRSGARAATAAARLAALHAKRANRHSTATPMPQPAAAVEQTPQTEQSTRPIEAILFRGNKRTKDITMRRELNLNVGDRVSDEDIERARQRVMDLGLFKSVEVVFEEIDQRETLVVTIKEKHYWFVLPKLSRNADGDVSYGIGLKYDNLFGLNQGLDFTLRRKDFNDADIDQSDTLRLEYSAPHIFDSGYDYSFDLRLEESNIEEEVVGADNKFDRELEFLRMNIGRWWDTSGVSKGWRFDAGFKYADYAHDFVSGDIGRYYDARVLSLIGGIRYLDVQDFLYSREGRQFGIEIEQAIDTDSERDDKNFSRQSVFWREFKRLGFREHTNLNMQFRLGYASHPLFGDPAFSVAGSRRIRGFERDSIEGNRFVIGNIEWLTPIVARKPAIRGVVFADFGSAWDSSDDFSFSDFHYGAGVGIRWRIRSLVKTEIRIDYAHGFDDGINRVYVGTRSTF